MRMLLGDRGAQPPGRAIKGGSGNNGAGSGWRDPIAKVLAVQNNPVPGASNSTAIDSSLGLKVITGKPVDARVQHAVSLAYALGGGQNAALVVKRYA